MGSITVRNLPDRVIRKLKQLAKQNRSSMEAEVRKILQREVMDRGLLLDVIKTDLDRQPEATTTEQVDAWIRESRERPV